MCGVVGRVRSGSAGLGGSCAGVSRSGLGWPTVDGESPVDVNAGGCHGCVSPSSSGPVKSAVNLPGPPGKPEYSLVTDSGRVP